jgi:hypothetical protein
LRAPRIQEIKYGTADLHKEFGRIYEYDGLGRIDYKVNLRAGGNQDSWETEYDGNNRLSVLKFHETGNRTRSTEFGYEYDSQGRMKKETETYGVRLQFGGDFNYTTYTNNYDYDGLGRLTYEKNPWIGNFSYKYNPAGIAGAGKISRVEDAGDGRVLKEFWYNSKGQMTRAGDIDYAYDTFGNVSGREGKFISYTRGNWLLNYGAIFYSYNHEGAIFKKSLPLIPLTTIVTDYYLDGGKILGEDRSDRKKLRYFYDLEGITGFRYYDGSTWQDYTYIKDGQGNVRKIFKNGWYSWQHLNEGHKGVVAEYEYSAFGEVTVKAYDNDGNLTSSTDHIAHINPFRWKGHYYDTATNLYRIYDGSRTRHYDPVGGIFLDSEGPEVVLCNCASLCSLDRNGIPVSPVWLQVYAYTMLCALGLLAHDSKNFPLPEPTWWEKNMSWLRPLLAVLQVISVVTMIGAGIGLIAGTIAWGSVWLSQALVAGGIAAISGTVVGGVIGGLLSMLTGNDLMDSIGTGMVMGALNGFAMGVIRYTVSSVIQAARTAAMSKTVSASAQTDKAMQVYNNFDVDNAYVKPKHLASTGGNGSKFAANTKSQAEAILKNTMRNGKMLSASYDGITQMGNTKYVYLLEAGKVVGTKGETLVQIVLSDDLFMLTAYPV